MIVVRMLVRRPPGQVVAQHSVLQGVAKGVMKKVAIGVPKNHGRHSQGVATTQVTGIVRPERVKSVLKRRFEASKPRCDEQPH